MAFIKKVHEVECYEINKDLNKFTRKERIKIVNDLFRNEYVGKEVKFIINKKIINSFITSETRNNYFAKMHSNTNFENNKEFNLRQDLTASGYYIPLVSNTDYTESKKEEKIGQNKYHLNSNIWHYFNKIIMCQDEYYLVKITVREFNGKYFIHNTRLKQIKKET